MAKKKSRRKATRVQEPAVVKSHLVRRLMIFGFFTFIPVASIFALFVLGIHGYADFPILIGACTILFLWLGMGGEHWLSPKWTELISAGTYYLAVLILSTTGFIRQFNLAVLLPLLILFSILYSMIFAGVLLRKWSFGLKK